MVLGYPEYEGKHSKKENQPPVSPMQPTEMAIPIEPEPQKEGGSMLTNLLGSNAKAIVSFVVSFGAQILARTFVDGTPVLPDDAKSWAGLIGASLLAAGLVWLKGNTESVDVLQRKLDKAAAKG